MKKFILTFTLMMFALILQSCRNDDNSNQQANGSRINPPAWIQGKWYVDNELIYTFTSNDIIIHSGGVATNIKPIADLGAYSQTSSDSEFSYTLHQLPNVTYTYKFRKVSSIKIVTDMGLSSDLDIELVKK